MAKEENMTTDEILKAATPRPWRISLSRDNKKHIYGAGISSPIVVPNASATKPHPVTWDTNVQAIMLAVNSYEKQRERIAELSGLLRELQSVLNAKEFNSMAKSLNAALARAEELL